MQRNTAVMASPRSSLAVEAAGNRTRCRKPCELRKYCDLTDAKPRGATCGHTERCRLTPKFTCPGERWSGAVQRDVDRLADDDGVHSRRLQSVTGWCRWSCSDYGPQSTLHWSSGPVPALVIVTVYPSLCSCAMVPAAPVSAIQLKPFSSFARQRTVVPSFVVAVSLS